MIKNGWMQIIVFLLLAGLVKGGLHIVKIVIIAGLGLAGMWMLHTLAQDYDKISTRFGSFSGGPDASAGGGTKAYIAKRSSDSGDTDIPGVNIFLIFLAFYYNMNILRSFPN